MFALEGCILPTVLPTQTALKISKKQERVQVLGIICS